MTTSARITVVVLGQSGAGKTMYLSALHHFLTTSPLADGIQFRLTDSRRAQQLRDHYAEASDSRAPWRSGTNLLDELSETTFECIVRTTEGKPIKAMEITLVDYAGDWIEQPGNVPEGHIHQLRRLADSARVAIVLIDGYHLLDHLNNKLSADDFFKNHVLRNLELAAQAHAVCVAVSKWDLLETRFTWEQVVQRLCAVNSSISAVIPTGSSKEARIRRALSVVPISSLSGLTYLDERGVIRKRIGAVPSQLNVEIPIASSIMSECWRILEEELKLGRPTPPGLPGRIKVGLTQVELDVRELAGFVFGMSTYSGRKAVSVFNWTFRRVRHAIRRRRVSDLSRVTDKQTAVLYTVLALQRRVDSFTAAHPVGLDSRVMARHPAEER